MARNEYDVIVIGGGPGGYTAAIRASQLGQETACIEMDDRLGGTCLLRGCIPTKALLHTADLLSDLQSAPRSGVQVESWKLDLAAAMKSKTAAVTKNAKGVEFLFKKNRITHERGRGALRGPNRVEVVQEGSSRELTARRGIILAMGSRPLALDAFPVDGKRILNSDQILAIDHVPSRLAVLGAGAVGTEFASIFSRFGSETLLVEMLPRVLPQEDEEVSAELERALKKQGIDVRTGSTLESAQAGSDSVGLTLEKDGERTEVEVDVLLVAVGRAPNSVDCGLEEIGVHLDRGVVQVGDDLQTAVEGVYAIGDLVRGPMLAHKASAEGIVAAERIAGHPTRPVDLNRIPGATYCRPEVASVGLTEQAAREAGYDIAVGKFPWAASGKARILHDTTGFVKIVRETRYDEILGVHIIGPHATDLISEACALLGLESTNEELGRIVHPHPTLGEAMFEASHVAAGRAIGM